MNEPGGPTAWDARCMKAGWAASILMSKIFHAEWQPDKPRGAGAAVLVQNLREWKPLDYEPDPAGRHKMKSVYYILYRIVIAALRLWSRPARWLDSRFWIKTDRFGTGLGAAVGVKLIGIEIVLLGLLKETDDACPHERPDRLAAADLNCPLCLTREVWRLRKGLEFLDARLKSEMAKGGKP